MLIMCEETKIQVQAVREKCRQLDVDYKDADLLRKFEDMLHYAATYRDSDLKCKSRNKLSPLNERWRKGEKLVLEHFSFWVSVCDPKTDKVNFGMAAVYHNGIGSGDGSFSVEINPPSGPHWSFHS